MKPATDLRARVWLATILVLVWMALPGRSGASAQSQNAGCTLDGSNVMAFGRYDSLDNSPLDQQGRVSYRCYNVNSNAGRSSHDDNDDHDDHDDGDDDDDDGGGGNKLIVQISLSTGNAGNFNRYMLNRDQLRYNIFMDASHQTVWGDGTGGTTIYTEHAQPNNQLTSIPTFGRVYGGQDVGAGQYTDVLIVTLDF